MKRPTCRGKCRDQTVSCHQHTYQNISAIHGPISITGVWFTFTTVLIGKLNHEWLIVVPLTPLKPAFVSVGRARQNTCAVPYIGGGSCCFWTPAEPRVLNWAKENRRQGAKGWHRLVIIMSGIRSERCCLCVGECVCECVCLSAVASEDTSSSWDQCSQSMAWRVLWALETGWPDPRAKTSPSAVLSYSFTIPHWSSELNHTD